MDLLTTPLMPTVLVAPDAPADGGGASVAAAFATVFAGVVPTSPTTAALATDATAAPDDPVAAATGSDDPADGETLSRLTGGARSAQSIAAKPDPSAPTHPANAVHTPVPDHAQPRATAREHRNAGGPPDLAPVSALPIVGEAPSSEPASATPAVIVEHEDGPEPTAVAVPADQASPVGVTSEAGAPVLAAAAPDAALPATMADVAATKPPARRAQNSVSTSRAPVATRAHAAGSGKGDAHRAARRRDAMETIAPTSPVALPVMQGGIVAMPVASDDAAPAPSSKPIAPPPATAALAAMPSIVPTGTTETVTPPIPVDSAIPAGSTTIAAAAPPVLSDMTATPAVEERTSPPLRIGRATPSPSTGETAGAAVPPVSIDRVQDAASSIEGDPQAAPRSIDRPAPAVGVAATVTDNRDPIANAAPALSALIAVADQRSAAREALAGGADDTSDAKAVPAAAATVAMLAARTGLTSAVGKATIAAPGTPIPADAPLFVDVSSPATVQTPAVPTTPAGTHAPATVAPAPALTTRDRRGDEPVRASRSRGAEPPRADATAPAAVTVAAATPVVASDPAPTASDTLAATGADRHVELARHATWADGIARDIAGAGATTGTARFTVAPATLGAVSVEVSRSADGAAVRLVASSAAARDALDAARPQLVAEARAQGLHIRDAAVDLAGSAGSGSGLAAHRDTGAQQAATLVADQPRQANATDINSLTTGAYGGASGGEAGRQAQQHARQPSSPPQTDRAAAARQPTAPDRGREEARRAADGRYA